MALTQLKTGAIADDAVTTDKLANAINTERTANTAKVSLGTDSVTGAKIADDAVGAEHIEQLDADLSFADSAKAKFGAGNDLQIYHSGSHSHITDAGTGGLKIRGSQVIIDDTPGDYMITATQDGSVDLYHNGTKKLETTAGGATVHCTDASDGFIVQGDLRFRKESGVTTYIKWDGSDEQLEVFDNVKVSFGDSHDLQIYHDGTTNIIEGLDGNMSLRPKTGENGILIRNNGSVDLYYDDVKQCETAADGLAFPSGKGISFAATSDYTGDGSGTPSELLDDYEEGTFTPRFQTSNGNWGGSMSSQNGSYTKIGNVVHVTFRLHWGSVSGTGNFRITALPFTVANVSSNQGSPVIGVRSGFNYARVTSYWMNNNQQLQFQYVDSSGSNGSFDLSVGALASTGYVYCSGWYETA